MKYRKAYVAAALSAAACGLPVKIASAETPPCEKFQQTSDASVVVDYNVETPNTTITLNPNCDYRKVQVFIKASNVVFDCQGAVLRGRRATTPPDFGTTLPPDDYPVDVGIRVWGYGGPVNNVTIRNCTVVHYKNAIGIDSPEVSEAEADLLSNPSTYEAMNTAIWARGISNVTIENITAAWSYGVGIYVHNWDDYVEIRNVSIEDTGAPAIYLSGRNAIVSDSRFSRTGYFDYDKNDDKRIVIASDHSKREAIAIDASANNIIRDSLFLDTPAGGVFLYKNCNEKSHRQSLRQHSHYNTIIHNEFVNGKRGVWIASRQWGNLAKWGCGDTPKQIIGEEKYYWDYAENTTVAYNTFSGFQFGVIAEDDSAIILSNRFLSNHYLGASGFAIEIGSKGKRVANGWAGYNYIDDQAPVHQWNTAEVPADPSNIFIYNTRRDGAVASPTPIASYTWDH